MSDTSIESAALHAFVRGDTDTVKAALHDMLNDELYTFRRQLRALAREVDAEVFTRYAALTETEG